MKNLILITLLTFPAIIFSQTGARMESQQFDDLSSALLSTQLSPEAPNLADIVSRAKNSAMLLSHDLTLTNVKCEGLYVWSEATESALTSYFQKIYNSYVKDGGNDWLRQSMLGISNSHNKVGIITWTIESAGLTSSFRSVAIFDDDWNVIFDTELAKYGVGHEIYEDIKADNGISDNLNTIVSEVSQTRSRLLNLNGAFGSVQLRYEVRATAIVDEYITSSTNDAKYNYFTNHIECERINPTGIPPSAEPFVFFGTGGEYTLQYQNSTPSTSALVIASGTGDRFNAGLYNISGANGQNWSFSFDFSVDIPGGGIGITPQSSISALSLSANSNSSVNILNYRYNHNVALGDVRAVFFDGGSMNADEFKIMTSSSAGEKGSISISSKLQVGYMYPHPVTSVLVPHFFNETTAALNLSVSYLRGDHVLQPEFALTSTNYNIQQGQVDTLKVKVTNRSRTVKLMGGAVSINSASLNNHLTLISAGTLEVGTIDTSSSKTFRFAVMGNNFGTVTPQATITSIGWGTPVPPEVTIDHIASINSNIEVGPLSKTLQLTTLVEGFYDPGSNTLNRDTATVYLCNTFSPFSIVDSAKTFPNSAGQGTYSFSRVSYNIPYFIVLKHRNSINTWSASGVAFTSPTISYDFTDSDLKAFGSNMKQVDTSPVKFAIYGGDIDRDETIDATDLSMIDNDAANFTVGYVPTDLTGDNFVDGTDIVIADNNAANFVSVAKP